MTLFTSGHVTPSPVSVAGENQPFPIFMEILGWLGGRLGVLEQYLGIGEQLRVWNPDPV